MEHVRNKVFFKRSAGQAARGDMTARAFRVPRPGVHPFLWDEALVLLVATRLGGRVQPRAALVILRLRPVED